MSIQSTAIKVIARASCLKWIIGSRHGMCNFIYHGLPKREAPPPRRLVRQFPTERYEFGGRPVYHIQPQDNSPNRHILYLHGGAYIAPIVRLHWHFLYRLIHQNPCRLTVPLYGLAPQYSYRDAFSLLSSLYRHLLLENHPQNIIFMGDSSGGGLALAFAQWLLENNLPQPGGVVMLSPWLDLTVSNPDIKAVEERDPLLAVAGAREAGKTWAAGSDLSIPRLSPVNGPLTGLAPMCLLTGTDDILMPDARLLRDKARTLRQPLHYLEYPSMFHAWMLLGWLPESKQALSDIINFMSRCG